MKSRKRSSTSPSLKAQKGPQVPPQVQGLPFIEQNDKGVFLRVRLQPRSSKNTIDGVSEGVLRLRLTAPPVEGEANRALIEFLSDIIGIRKSSLSIDSGLKSRDKKVRVEGLGVRDLEKALLDALK